MAKTGGADLFANQAVITVTESAASTLTFKKLETGISLFEKIAWVIHRLEWLITPTVYMLLNSTGDQLALALTVSDQITTLSLTNAAILDLQTINRIDFGTAAAAAFYPGVVFKDFTGLPGGGLIVPPTPLYGASQGTGLASATQTVAKLFYTTKQLTPDEYWELVEARRLISS